MNYTIREIEEADVDRVREVAELSPPLRAAVKGTYEHLAICFKKYFLVAEEKDEVVGFIVGFPNVNVNQEAWVYQVAVKPTHRRRKIAENLLNEEVKRFKLDGY